MNLNFLSKFVHKKVSGRTIYLRKKSVDSEVFDYVFVEKYHRPFKEVGNPSPVILDLGTNVGLTVVDFKMLYPGAKIYAYEMDKENYDMAVKNCDGLQDVFLFNKAVWVNSGFVEYDKNVNDDAYKIDVSSGNSGNKIQVATISIDDIIAKNNLTVIDYVKMDIEGAEYEIFQQETNWLKLTREIKIEVHYGADIFEFIQGRLQHYGFTTVKDTHHWSTLIGYRNEG